MQNNWDSQNVISIKFLLIELLGNREQLPNPGVRTKKEQGFIKRSLYTNREELGDWSSIFMQWLQCHEWS
jgi:hypothetical protein